MADQFRESGAVSRAFELAWAHSQVEHRHHEPIRRRTRTCSSDWPRTSSSGRQRPCGPTPSVLAREPPGPARPSGAFGISGDRPIVLARIGGGDQLVAGPRSCIAAHDLPAAHPRSRVRPRPARRGAGDQLPRRAEPADPDRPASAAERQPSSGSTSPAGSSSARLSADPDQRTEQILVQAYAARVVLVGDRGPLASQLDRTERVHGTCPPGVRSLDPRARSSLARARAGASCPRASSSNNGLGGFTADGREYCDARCRASPPPRRPAATARPTAITSPSAASETPAGALGQRRR